MGAVLNRSYGSIQSKIRSLPFQKKVKKHAIESHFFKSWSQEMAYVLGFIAADGNIYKNGNIHMLHIACDDLDVIEKIKKTMRYDGPIYQKLRFNGKISYNLRICDRIIFQDLQKLKITQRKSLTITPPDMSEYLIRHFVRGYFDGDGSVCLSNRNYPGRLVAMFYTASFSMGIFLYEVLKKELGDLFKGNLAIKIAHQKTKYYTIALGHKAAQRLYNYMYKGAKGLYMERKYNKFIEGMDYYARSI